MSNANNVNFSRKKGTARLSNRMNSVILTIDECIKEKRLFPALILIYSSIDILGALQSDDGYSTNESFKEWVINYLLVQKTFPFDEKDLWGARCSVVHTMRYDPKPTSSFKEIVYGLSGHDEDIRKISDPSCQVGIYIEDLFEAFKKAYSQCLADLENSTDATVNANLNKLPDYVDLIPWD